MKIHVTQSESSIDFDALGRTLQLLDGDRVTLGLGFCRQWPADDDAGTALLGGTTGTLRVPVTEADLPTGPRASVPVDAIEPGEQAYLLEVGATLLGISSAEFVGASYCDGVLAIQVGPLLMSLTRCSEESTNA
jgi:hypothetical protein